jgi:hypothetical protein
VRLELLLDRGRDRVLRGDEERPLVELKGNNVVECSAEEHHIGPYSKPRAQDGVEECECQYLLYCIAVPSRMGTRRR